MPTQFTNTELNNRNFIPKIVTIFSAKSNIPPLNTFSTFKWEWSIINEENRKNLPGPGKPTPCYHQAKDTIFNAFLFVGDTRKSHVTISILNVGSCPVNTTFTFSFRIVDNLKRYVYERRFVDYNDAIQNHAIVSLFSTNLRKELTFVVFIQKW